jgi:hypothetical protein
MEDDAMKILAPYGSMQFLPLSTKVGDSGKVDRGVQR